MRVRDHVVLSTAGAALLYPRVGIAVFGGWAASILIDADHYAWFCVRKRSLDPRAAVRFFNGAHAPDHPATRVLHSPMVLLTLLLLSTRRRRLLPVALGMTFHVALDVHHQGRIRNAKAATLQRDGFTCQVCGTRDQVTAHLTRQPWFLPSYRTDNFITLCSACHEAAHQRRKRTISGPGR